MEAYVEDVTHNPSTEYLRCACAHNDAHEHYVQGFRRSNRSFPLQSHLSFIMSYRVRGKAKLGFSSTVASLCPQPVQ